MKLVITGALPTMNEIIAESKRHYATYSKMKSHFTGLVSFEAKAQKIPQLIGLHDYEITWYVPNRKKDKDNIMAGQKFIFDGLINSGVLHNDGWEQIGSVIHKFAVDEKHPRVEIEIRKVGAA